MDSIPNLSLHSRNNNNHKQLRIDNHDRINSDFDPECGINVSREI